MFFFLSSLLIYIYIYIIPFVVYVFLYLAFWGVAWKITVYDKIMLSLRWLHSNKDVSLSKFLRRSLMIFIIKSFRTIFFIFIVISKTFQPICPPAFFRCLSNSGTFTELRTTSFIEYTGIACSDSVSHNRVQVLSIPVLLLASQIRILSL